MSGEIVCSDLTTGEIVDPTALPGLLDQIEGPVEMFLADGAYFCPRPAAHGSRRKGIEIAETHRCRGMFDVCFSGFDQVELISLKRRN